MPRSTARTGVLVSILNRIRDTVTPTFEITADWVKSQFQVDEMQAWHVMELGIKHGKLTRIARGIYRVSA